MTERETAERLQGLIALADKLRMPGHRRSAERCMEEQDELRDGLRRLHRDLTGTDLPREASGGHRVQSMRSVGLVVPAAIARHRERQLRARA